MNDETLKKLQDCETSILASIDKFCAIHNIKYSLYAGTALGAIRHKGFIPWDDDIDICMERNEYERFISLWEENGPTDELFFQDPENEESRINHAKVRKNGTILGSIEELKEKGHHGIWLDIFPIDKVPNEKRKKRKFLFVSKVRLVYTRGYTIKNKGKFLRFLSKVMLLLPRKIQIKIRKRCDKYIKKYRNITNDYCLMCLAAPNALRMEYPSDLFDNIDRVPFGNYKFRLTNKWHEMLSVNYGAYMQLPPENERFCTHKPEVILFGNEE